MAHNRHLNARGFSRDAWEPGYWPRWARVIFLLTSPVSLAVYGLLILAVLVLASAFAALVVMVGILLSLAGDGLKVFHRDL